MSSLLLAHICNVIFNRHALASRVEYPFRFIFQLFADKKNFASFVFLMSYFRVYVVCDFIFEFHRFISVESKPKQQFFDYKSLFDIMRLRMNRFHRFCVCVCVVASVRCDCVYWPTLFWTLT